MAEVCKSDLRRLVKYLDDAADLYGKQPGQCYKARQFYLRQYSKKLTDKLNKFHNEQTGYH